MQVTRAISKLRSYLCLCVTFSQTSDDQLAKRCLHVCPMHTCYKHAESYSAHVAFNM